MTKEQILAEIRRTTAANGGVALGQERFTRDTGIPKAEWYGRYWARWSDALREAGVSPNVFIEAYPPEVLIRKLVDLTRELGHFPLEAHLRLRHRDDPTFPAHTTFSRLGNKHQRLARVREFCRSRAELQEVVALLGPDVGETKPSEPPLAQADTTSDGTVYLIKFGKYYKIGHTNALGRRKYEIGLQVPGEIRLVHEFNTDDPSGIERYWHERFRDKRVKGEFFQLTQQDITAFKRRKRFM
jgi:hypothetical protein